MSNNATTSKPSRSAALEAGRPLPVLALPRPHHPYPTQAEPPYTQNTPVQPPCSPGVPWCLLSTKRTRDARDNRVDQDTISMHAAGPPTRTAFSDALSDLSGWEGVGRSLRPHTTRVSTGCHHPSSSDPSSDRASTKDSLTIYP